MRIARVEVNGIETYAFVLNGMLVSKDDLDLPDTIEEIIKLNLPIHKRRVLSNYRLLPPIAKPSKIICLGFNYLDHAAEQGFKPPEDPVIFMKPRTALAGANDRIICPRFVRQLDYEGELAFVISKDCKNVRREEAMNFVLGYMVFNDVSARDIQFSDKQWTRGKGFDTFAPCGPWLTTSDEIKDPHSLRIITRVNDELRQNSSTAMMALKIDRIIESLSKVMTLEEGDIIATGTPAGTGAFMKEPRFLKDNDTITIEIEGLGSIRNTVSFTD